MTGITPVHFFDIDSTLPGMTCFAGAPTKTIKFETDQSTPLGPSRSWSSNTLKIRMVLNYKSIPYTQSFTSYPDIAPLLKSLSVPPHTKGRVSYTLPAICHPESIRTSPSGAMMDSLPVARHLDKTFPTPPLFPSGQASYTLAVAVENIMLRAAGKGLFLLLPKAANVLDQRAKGYFLRTRSEWFGKPLLDLEITDEDGIRTALDAMKGELEIFLRMLTDRLGEARGPFLEGEQPGYADFILVTFLSWGHRVDMKIWEELMAMGDGEFRTLWDACLPWMEGQGEDREWQIPNV